MKRCAEVERSAAAMRVWHDEEVKGLKAQHCTQMEEAKAGTEAEFRTEHEAALAQARCECEAALQAGQAVQETYKTRLASRTQELEAAKHPSTLAPYPSSYPWPPLYDHGHGHLA